MWTPRSSPEPCVRCQVVSVSFGRSHIFFCQHSHAPHPDRPQPRERREREGCTCYTVAFSPSRCFMTEAIWQLRYLSLLFLTQGLASAQDQTTHAHTANRCTENIYHIFFPNNTEVTGMEANGVNLKCIVVGVREFYAWMYFYSEEFLFEKNNIFEKRKIIFIKISIR